MNDALYALFTRVHSGAITLAYGLELARGLTTEADFDDNGIHPLARSAIQAARAGHTEAACTLWRLVLEALDQARTPAQHEAAGNAASAWITIASLTLLRTADGRILADARRRGEALVETLAGKGDDHLAGLVLFNLGAMLLDPYIERRDSTNFMTQVAAWSRQGRETAIDLGLAGSVDVPPPAAALADAASLLERSAALRQGRERGRSLKALAEARYWHGVATGAFDRAAIEQTMRDALNLLDPVDDEMPRAQLRQYARALDIDLGAAEETPAGEMTPGEAAADPRGFIHALMMKADAARDPEAALNHLLAALAFAASIDDEDGRTTAMSQLIARATNHYGIDALVERAGAGPGDDAGWGRAHAAIFAKAGAGEWTARDAALASVALAMHTSGANREDAGLEILERTAASGLADAPDEALALATMQATLAFFLGVTHVSATDWEAAVCQYLDAAREAVAAGMRNLARDAFRHAADIFGRLERPGSPALLRALSASLPALQSELGAAEGMHVIDMWRTSLRDAAFVTPQFDGLERALQGAKGASLPIARHGHEIRPVLSVPAVQKARQLWASKRDEVGPAPRSGLIDSNLLLAAYAYDPGTAGATPPEELGNLAREFDAVLFAELSRGAGRDTDFVLDQQALCRRIPEGTVLVSTMPCPTDTWSLGFVVLLATPQGAIVRRAETSEPMARMFGVDGVYVDELGPVVADLRRHLLLAPASEASAARVTSLLSALFDYALGAVEDDLRRLHGLNFRHLCINPHGALHFCPMGLLTSGGRHLADDWIVTHLPSLGLLGASHAGGTPPAPRSGATVFGLGFESGMHGLGPLAGAVIEAHVVAQALGTDPVLDDDATAGRFNEALRTSRYVHLATHGQQDAAAPALQTVFLAPDDQHDGQYAAYEVLQQPLAGLELVTLSACETALGRIDIMDNPRGLQAFLFTGGAATVVSCLWRVADEVASFFFEAFYRELAGERTRLAAFGEAQRLTREQYSEYREWGAFQFSGTWEATGMGARQ